MSKITTKLKDSLYSKIESIGLTKQQHDIAVEMLKNNLRVGSGGFTLDEADGELVNIWISEAFSGGDEAEARFLSSALAKDATVYEFVDHLGDFYQTLGYVTCY